MFTHKTQTHQIYLKPLNGGRGIQLYLHEEQGIQYCKLSSAKRIGEDGPWDQ